MLENSPKFTRLMKYLGQDNDFISFNFQLSGLFQSMNFKWLESEFKQKLENLLPSKYEKGLEDEIEKIIESISAT